MDYSSVLQTHNYIGGEFVEGLDPVWNVYQKYTGEIIAGIRQASVGQVKQSIESASQAFRIYKNYSAEKRAEVLEYLYQGLKKRKEDFARLIAAEAGKPIAYARIEVDRGLDNIRTGIRETLSFSGRKIPMDYLNGKGKTAYTVRIPTGPVLGITPFNFPLNLVLHKLIPALAVGTSIILKPAPQAPLTALALANLLADAGLPAGTVNIIFTSHDNTEIILRDDRVNILSFTGSDKVGWKLKEYSGKKKVFLEMGGNAAVIIDESANLKHTIKKLVYGAFLYAGQICISTQRIYVSSGIFDEFITAFIEETGKVKSGDMFDEKVINSSMISRDDIQRIDSWVNQSIDEGATVLTGGKVLDKSTNIYAPTVLTGTSGKMKIVSEEAFAPVVVIESFSSFPKAVEMVNDSRYGLQASVFTSRLDQVLYAQRYLDVGGLIINDIPGFRIDSMPYGGIKDSGLGREGAYSAMLDYTEPKLVVLGS
jgi:glyceraldehyde-3-phosphate dehydrogenase (NADP+)